MHVELGVCGDTWTWTTHWFTWFIPQDMAICSPLWQSVLPDHDSSLELELESGSEPGSDSHQSLALSVPNWSAFGMPPVSQWDWKWKHLESEYGFTWILRDTLEFEPCLLVQHIHVRMTLREGTPRDEVEAAERDFGMDFYTDRTGERVLVGYRDTEQCLVSSLVSTLACTDDMDHGLDFDDSICMYDWVDMTTIEQGSEARAEPIPDMVGYDEATSTMTLKFCPPMSMNKQGGILLKGRCATLLDMRPQSRLPWLLTKMDVCLVGPRVRVRERETRVPRLMACMYYHAQFGLTDGSGVLMEKCSLGVKLACIVFECPTVTHVELLDPTTHAHVPVPLTISHTDMHTVCWVAPFTDATPTWDWVHRTRWCAPFPNGFMVRALTGCPNKFMWWTRCMRQGILL